MPPEYTGKIKTTPAGTVFAMFNNGAGDYGKTEQELRGDLLMMETDTYADHCREALHDLSRA